MAFVFISLICILLLISMITLVILSFFLCAYVDFLRGGGRKATLTLSNSMEHKFPGGGRLTSSSLRG